MTVTFVSCISGAAGLWLLFLCVCGIVPTLIDGVGNFVSGGRGAATDRSIVGGIRTTVICFTPHRCRAPRGLGLSTRQLHVLTRLFPH